MKNPIFWKKNSDKFKIRITQNSVIIYSTLRKVHDSIESGNITEAFSIFNQVALKFHYHTNALIGLGNICYANKKYERAPKIYQTILKDCLFLSKSRQVSCVRSNKIYVYNKNL